MNFRRSRASHGDSSSEINVIPLIDILLVMLIFLASTTAFTRYTQLEVVLPEAGTPASPSDAATLAISEDGRYALNGRLVDVPTPGALADALRRVVDGPAPTLLINADGRASHQSVVNAMEAARLAGIERVNFAARTGP